MRHLGLSLFNIPTNAPMAARLRLLSGLRLDRGLRGSHKFAVNELPSIPLLYRDIFAMDRYRPEPMRVCRPKSTSGM